MVRNLSEDLKNRFLGNLADAFALAVRPQLSAPNAIFEEITNRVVAAINGASSETVEDVVKSITTKPNIPNSFFIEADSLRQSILRLPDFKEEFTKFAKHYKNARDLEVNNPEQVEECYKLFEMINGNGGQDGYYQGYGKLLDTECDAHDAIADPKLLAALVTNTPASKLNANKEITAEDLAVAQPVEQIVTESVKGAFIDKGVGYISTQFTRANNAFDSARKQYHRHLRDIDKASDAEIKYKAAKDRLLVGQMNPALTSAKAVQTAVMLMEYGGLTCASNKNIGIHNLTVVERGYIPEFMKSAEAQGIEMSGEHLKVRLAEVKKSHSDLLLGVVTDTSRRDAETYRAHGIIDNLYYPRLSQSRRKLQEAVSWFGGGESKEELIAYYQQIDEFDSRVTSYTQGQMVYEAHVNLAAAITERLNPSLYSHNGDTAKYTANAIKSGTDFTTEDHFRVVNQLQRKSEHAEYSGNMKQVWQVLNLGLSHLIVRIDRTIPSLPFFSRAAKNILSKQVEVVMCGKLMTDTFRNIVKYHELCGNGKTRNINHYVQLGKNWQIINGMCGALKNHFAHLNPTHRMTAQAWKSVRDGFPFLVNKQFGSLDANTSPTYQEFMQALNSVRAQFRNMYRSSPLDVEVKILTPNDIHPLRNSEQMKCEGRAVIAKTHSIADMFDADQLKLGNLQYKATDGYILMPDIASLYTLKTKLQDAQQLGTVYSSNNHLTKTQLEQSNLSDREIELILLRKQSEELTNFQARNQIYQAMKSSRLDIVGLMTTYGAKNVRDFQELCRQENELLSDFLEQQQCFMKRPINANLYTNGSKDARIVSNEVVQPDMWQEVIETLAVVQPNLLNDTSSMQWMENPFISKANQPSVPPEMDMHPIRIGSAHAHKVDKKFLASEYDAQAGYHLCWDWDNKETGRLYLKKVNNDPVMCYRSADVYSNCTQDNIPAAVAQSPWVKLHHIATPEGVKGFVDSINKFKQKISDTEITKVANAAREKFVGSTCENCHKIITVSRMLKQEFGVKKPDDELIIPDRTPWVINIFGLKFSIPSKWFFRNSDRPTSSKNIEHYTEDSDGMLRMAEQSPDYSMALRMGSTNRANNIVKFQSQRIQNGFYVAKEIMDSSQDFALKKGSFAKLTEGDIIPSAVSTATLQELMENVVGARV